MATAVRHVRVLRSVIHRSLYLSTQLLARDTPVWVCQVPANHRRFQTSLLRLQDDENNETKEKIDEEPPRPIIDVETSKRYLNSKAYNITYGEEPVWVPYRRNFKGQIPPQKTRRTCMIKGKMATGNPCPICRDEYLVLNPENIELLQQFISPQTGEVLSYKKTGVCQKQHKALLIAVEQAWDHGYIEKPLPFREYDYSIYYPQLKDVKQQH